MHGTHGLINNWETMALKYVKILGNYVIVSKYWKVAKYNNCWVKRILLWN